MAANESSEIDISVVVASIESERRIHECLASIVNASVGRKVEIIVADASRDDSARIVRVAFPSVNLVTLPPGALAPELWAKGLASARGRRVAFTTGHFRVGLRWVSELSAALDAGNAGAGGPLLLDAAASLVDSAIYFLRYSAFLPDDSEAPHGTREIAGDNSMYDRDVLSRHESTISHGFWEVELHERLRSEDLTLATVPSAAISFGSSFPIGVISRHRYAHGKHFGRWRVEKGTSRARIVLAAPLAPFSMLARTFARVTSSRANVGRMLLSSPIFIWLAACWAAGEVAGAFQSGGNAHRR
jgi:hypothetical protein